VVFDLACALTKLNHKVVVIASKGSKVPPKGFLIECGEPELKVQTNWLEAERKMWQSYKKYLEDFDIIHSHTWFGFIYASKTKNQSLKVCHTHHGHLNMAWWGRSKPPFKLNLIAISEWMSRIYKAQGFNCKYVYNGINLERYPFQKEKGDRLLFVGRIDKFKQTHVAIEVAKKLGMGLDIVGGTFVQDPDYLQQIRRLCDGKQICFYPDAPHETKVNLMQNAKCLLFPSAMGEPFGLVAVEAMSCGTPVVALNDGAIEEVVKEGGVVCDVFDKKLTPKGPVYTQKRNPTEALAEAIKNVDKISPEHCRKNAERFSREKMAENYLKIYKEILAGFEF